MNVNIIDHLAYATKNTDKTMEVFSILGFKKQLYHKQVIDKFDSSITKLESESGQVLELVEPNSNISVVQNLLHNKFSTIYHAAFLTDDLMAMLNKLKAIGTVVITEPMTIPYPSSDAHKQYKTCHLFHPYVGLFEVTGPSK